jgi:hypothetical protein
MDGSNASAHYGAPLPTGTRAPLTRPCLHAPKPCRCAMFLEETREQEVGAFLCGSGCVVCVGSGDKRVYTHLKTRIRTYPRIRTPACVYAPPAYTHPCLRIRTYPRIRTLGCVYARTCVYAPTPAYKHVCVNAASGAYTHLPAYTHPTLRLRGDATNVMEPFCDFAPNWIKALESAKCKVPLPAHRVVPEARLRPGRPSH